MTDKLPLFMITAAEVAQKEGITKQAVTKMVRKFVEDHSLPVERDGRNRIVKFSLAHFEAYREQFGNSEQTAAARLTSIGPEIQSEATHTLSLDNSTSRDEALRRDAWLTLEKKAVLWELELGRLIVREALEVALQNCGKEIQNVINRLPNSADDIALAMTKEGEHGVRTILRKISFRMGNEIADRLEAIASGAPKSDELDIEIDA